jgi:hypothetical protein
VPRGNSGRGLLDVVDAVKMGVIYSGKLNALVATLDGKTFVQQHLNAHILKSGHHSNSVVIT